MRLLWNQGAGISFRAEDFFGREAELNTLLHVCMEGRSGIGSSVMIYGPPNIGKSSLLLKLKTDLQALPEGSALPLPFPFYYSFSKILSHPLALSQHFLQEYLWQLLAFFGEEPPSAFDPEAMCERLSVYGLPRCRDFLAAHRRHQEAGDGLSALVNAFSYPFSTGGDRFYPVFLFDDFQYTLKLQGVPEGAFLSILRPYIKSGHFPMIVSGSSPGHVTSSLKREGLFGAFQLMEIAGLSAEASRRMWSATAARRKIEIPESLVARATMRLGHVPFYLRMFAEEMTFRNVRVTDEVSLENLYALSVTEGQLNRYWREFFETSYADRSERARAVKFLKRVLFDNFSPDTFEGALSLMGASADDGGRILSMLEFRGLVKSDFEQLRFASDPVLSDFLFWAFERGVLGKNGTQVAQAIVQSKLVRGVPGTPEGERERIAGIAKELMRRWDLREVPLLLFEFGKFLEKYGGKGLLEIVVGMEKEPVKVRLPKISSVSTGYRGKRTGPRFGFDLVAYGFTDADFSEENLVIWAVDVDTEKSLAVKAVEHFENRCRLLAIEKGLREGQIRKWIVFDGSAESAAVEFAARQDIYLTHRAQLRLFLNIFGIDEIPGAAETRKIPDIPPSQETMEFELVLPIKADTEVVAARVAEEVAAYAALDKDSVDRIKMALIEACINAFEHSDSATGKVRLRYVLSPERIELFVIDEGKGFRPAKAREGARRNRGWGLKLIRELVDDVEITTGETGTVVRMIKLLAPAETGGGGEDKGREKGEEEERT